MHFNRVAILHLTLDHVGRERIQQTLLDKAAQWTRTVSRVIALLGKPCLRSIIDAESDALLTQAFIDFT